MNTERSDRFVSEWTARDNPLGRANFVVQRTFKTSPENLFRLLCPATEYDWIPIWKCELLHSGSGYAEHNAIFRTDVNGMEEIFVCTRYEPGKAIEYIRFSKDFCVKMDFTLIDNCDGTVMLLNNITISALNHNVNEALAGINAASKSRFEEVFNALEYYVDTGEMITDSSIE